MDDDKFGYKVTDTEEGRPSLCISVPGMKYPLRIILPPRDCLDGELMDATGCTSIDIPGTSRDPPYPLCEDLCCEEPSSICVVARSDEDLHVRQGVVCSQSPRENRRRTVQASRGKERADARNRKSPSPNRNLMKNRNSRSPSPSKNIQKPKTGTNCRLVCDVDESSIALPAMRRNGKRRETVCNTRNLSAKKSMSPEAAHVTTEARGFLNVCSQTDALASPRRLCDDNRFMKMLIPTKNLMKDDDCCVLKEKFDSIQVLAQAVYNANCRNTTVSRLIEHRESGNQTDKVIDKRGMSVQTEKKPDQLREMSTEISQMNYPKKHVEIVKPEEKTDPSSIDKQVETEKPEEKRGSADKQVETEKPEDQMNEEKKSELKFGSKASFMLVDDSVPQLKNLKEKNPNLKSSSLIAQNAEIPSKIDPIPEEPEKEVSYPTAPEEKAPSMPPNEEKPSIPPEERKEDSIPIAQEPPVLPDATPVRHICEYCKSIKCICVPVEEKPEEKKLKFEEPEKNLNEEKPIKPILRMPSEGNLEPQENIEEPSENKVDSGPDWRNETRPIDFSPEKSLPPDQIVEEPIPKEISPVIEQEEPSKPEEKVEENLQIPEDKPDEDRHKNILGLSPGESFENMKKRKEDKSEENLPNVISEPTATPEMSKVTEPLNPKSAEPKKERNIDSFNISYEPNCPVFDRYERRYSARGVRTVPDVYEYCFERPQSMDSIDAARASCVNRRRRPEYECDERVTVYVPDDRLSPRYVPSEDDRAQYFYVPSTSNKGTSQKCEEDDKEEDLAEKSTRSVRIQSEENQYFEDTTPRRGILGSIWDGIRNIF